MSGIGRTAWCASAFAVGAIGCSGGDSGPGAFTDAGKDARVDAGVDGPADAATDHRASDASDGSDAAPPLPTCDHGKTCALPLTCDDVDLLCEPPCDAMHACSAGTFCTPIATGSLDGHCVGADYQCLGNVPVLPQPTATYVTVTTTYVDVSGGAGVPAASLTVRACAKTDPPCAAALAEGTTSAAGAVILSLPTGTSGFDGYFDVTGPSGDGGMILETLVFSSEPVVATGYGPTTNVESAAALRQALAALGTLDPTRAQVMVVDDACRSTPAFGASLAVSSADAATRIGYVGASGIDGGATTFPVNDQALAYAVNVPGATATLTTTYGGQTVNRLDVVLRPNVLVIARLDPVP